MKFQSRKGLTVAAKSWRKFAARIAWFPHRWKVWCWLREKKHSSQERKETDLRWSGKEGSSCLIASSSSRAGRWALRAQAPTAASLHAPQWCHSPRRGQPQPSQCVCLWLTADSTPQQSQADPLSTAPPGGPFPTGLNVYFLCIWKFWTLTHFPFLINVWDR